MSTDPEHKFELALHLGELKMAHQLAQEAEVRAHAKTTRSLSHICNTH